MSSVSPPVDNEQIKSCTEDWVGGLYVRGIFNIIVGLCTCWKVGYGVPERTLLGHCLKAAMHAW